MIRLGTHNNTTLTELATHHVIALWCIIVCSQVSNNIESQL